jgi:hypothetical protein
MDMAGLLLIFKAEYKPAQRLSFILFRAAHNSNVSKMDPGEGPALSPG